ncbi:TerC family protein [Neobacillus bataviensis]|uniref:TerC family protein n=1 Tax=Neobacillus bataviensis TaxID=220685 RepID=UPI001CC0CB0A|nr:tellurium resistance protein TerC [Neobacillus bataviensis]
MGDIIKVFFMNSINDLDNLLIISAVIRKYGYKIGDLLIYIILSITLSRTIYVMVIHSLAELPGLRFITGVIILFIAIRLVWSIENDNKARTIPSISIFRMILIVLATDFSVCLDSVIITAELSSTPLFIITGIFLSVSAVFFLYNSFSEILGNTSWIQVIASGLIAHIAILSIVKDPITRIPVLFIEKFFEIHINSWINIFALDIAIIVIIIGVIRRFQNRTIL